MYTAASLSYKIGVAAVVACTTGNVSSPLPIVFVVVVAVAYLHRLK